MLLNNVIQQKPVSLRIWEGDGSAEGAWGEFLLSPQPVEFGVFLIYIQQETLVFQFKFPSVWVVFKFTKEPLPQNP